MDTLITMRGVENGRPTTTLIDTAAALSSLIDTLDGLPTEPPSLYLDLEGDNLSRHGSVSILQLHVLPTSCTYLVDIHTLRQACFSTSGADGRTMKDILESEAIPKVFFDVRNDSDALYSHFQIRLGGIQDLQLMELATRSFSRRCINGLSKCIERDAPLSLNERHVWQDVKQKGVQLFAPEHGGSYQVFNMRPLSNDIMLYCAQDVQYLPRLWKHYNSKLTPAWRQRVAQSSKERVALSQATDFNGKGRHMALAPSGWA